MIGNSRHSIGTARPCRPLTSPDCAELIHFFSINFTLKPGMVIITGTPAGTSWSVDKELGGTWTPSAGLIAATRYCLPGDIIESEIEKIGLLRTVVVAG